MTEELNDILLGCQKGRRDAQERLYKMFSSKMYGVCLRYCRNNDEAKDILQDGFIKVFEKISQFGQRGSFEGWVRRIMMNTALERFRKLNPVLSYEQVPEIHVEEPEDEDLGISMKEMLSLVQSLPDRYRMVFNMYVFDELTHKEIAGELGINEGTSKSDLSRARGILQNKITNKIKQIAQTG